MPSCRRATGPTYVVADLATLRAPRRPRDDIFRLPPGFMSAIDESRERVSGSREKGRDPSVEVAVGAQNDLMVGSDERQLAAPHDRPPNRVPIDVNMNPRLAGRRQ